MLHVAPLGFLSFPTGGYVPAGAIWLDGSADTLTWTPAGAGDSNQDVILSFWIKLTSISTSTLAWFSCVTDGSNELTIAQNTSGTQFDVKEVDGGVTEYEYIASAVERDTTAWTHWLLSWDTNNGTAADRLRIWKNGTEITAFDTQTTMASGYDLQWGQAAKHCIGSWDGSGQFQDMYLAECIKLDGSSIQAGDYAITDFVDTDANGAPIPVDPSGLTFGTNGFWLNFADSADLGNDVSGNNNDFTPTSMSAANSTSDRPADDADTDVGNYSTLLPISSPSPGTYSNGNLSLSPSADEKLPGTIAFDSSDSDGFYWEVTVGANVAGTLTGLGIGVAAVNGASSGSTYQWENDGYDAKPRSYFWQGTNTDYFEFDDTSSTGHTAFADDDIVGFFIRNGKSWVHVNGTWQNSGNPNADTNPMDTTITGTVCPYFNNGGGNRSSFSVNFGQSSFSYTPPTNAKKLSTDNLPAPTVTDPSAYFQTVLYTGNGTAIGSGGKAVTGVGFQPDFVWIKNRDAVDSHMVFDVARGATKYIETDTTDAEATDTESLSTFDSDGFTVGSNVAVNTNTENYVAWCMKAGGTASTNTDGDVNSSISVAAHGGFSVGTFTTSSSAGTGFTIGHGLSRTPNFLVTYLLGGGSAWQVWHDDLGGADKWIRLNLNIAVETDTTAWNNTAPTSTVWSTHTSWTGTNASAWFMAFAKTPGLIGIGKYIGNGSSDGPYVVVDDGGSGFRPAFVLIRRIDTGNSWQLFDNQRSPYNVCQNTIYPDLNSAENPSDSTQIDMTANGFKLRGSTASSNAIGGTYIYLAFAEYPFGGDGVAQAKAR